MAKPEKQWFRTRLPGHMETALKVCALVSGVSVQDYVAEAVRRRIEKDGQSGRRALTAELRRTAGKD